jgi:multiple antibiotic resistance protein
MTNLLEQLSAEQISQAVVAVLAIANPIGAALVSINLTDDMDPAQRKRAGRQVVVWVFAILMVSIFSGVWLLKAFGVSLAAFQAAGGLIIAMIGLEMMRGGVSAAHGAGDDDGGTLVIPLAMPMVAGPGTIATVIALMARTDHPGLGSYIAPTVAVVVCSVVLGILFRASGWLRKHIGEQEKRMITRFLGPILAAIGAQMLLSGATRIVEQEVKSEESAMIGGAESSPGSTATPTSKP